MAEAVVGVTGRPFTMRVELGKVREFARATKSSNPAYLESETPVSPVTFLMTAALWQGPENRPSGGPRSYERVLHGEQEFVFHGEPPRAGTVLTGRSRIDRVYEKEGRRGGTMTFSETVTEYRDEQDRLVAETRSTVIETSRAPEKAS
jgi:hypothetical protein